MIKKDYNQLKKIQKIEQIKKKVREKEYTPTKEEKLNKKKFEVYQSEYLSKCKQYVFNGFIW